LPWLDKIYEKLPVDGREITDQHTDRHNTVCLGVCSMPIVFSIFASRMSELRFINHPFGHSFHGVKQSLKVLKIGLGIMYCNEHGTIYAISSDFGDRMTTQSMVLIFLLSEHF
jgi:hypothetical protein